ncbi:MAG: GNAT family N-acetyltransferase [Methyloceanibacter sp.]|uniref:GNAT family N-acetyltransferase n=1 Tax=Methyloceanibacter sp. TaxID=1965321 RepID=UPI003D9BA1C4
MQITTQRLVLRPIRLTDAPRLALLAGDYDVASMTGTIPHPYSEQMAGEWIASALAGEEGVVFAILRSGVLIGCTGYRTKAANHAEMGYWIGKPFWGQGYATEAVRALIRHAFDTDRLEYLIAGHFADNAASQRVIRKLGFEPFGGETRDCAARGTEARCLTYRLDRARAPAALAG